MRGDLALSPFWKEFALVLLNILKGPHHLVSTRALFWDHQNTNICVLLQYNRSLYKCRVLIHFFNSDSTTQWCCVLGDSLLHLRLHGLEMVKVKTDRPKACCGRREATASSDIFLSRFSLSNLLRCNLDELRAFLVLCCEVLRPGGLLAPKLEKMYLM